jgi:hypothetical protein
LNTLVRPLRRTVFVVASLALALAGWACSGSSSSGSSSSGGTGGSCQGPYPVPVPKTACDPSKDVYTQCPLPATVTSPDVSNPGYDTVYYFSDPACQSGVCTYCVTSTTSEDPCETSAAPNCP